MTYSYVKIISEDLMYVTIYNNIIYVFTIIRSCYNNLEINKYKEANNTYKDRGLLK